MNWKKSQKRSFGGEKMRVYNSEGANGNLTCEGCRYHDSFTWSCSCADSPYCADFTNDGCECYECELRE